MATTTVGCPSCGAPADQATVVGVVYRCRYCSAAFRLDGQGGAIVADRGTPTTRRIVVLTVTMVVLGGAVAGVVVLRVPTAPPPVVPAVQVPALPPSPATPLATTAVPVEVPGRAEATFTPHARYVLSTGSLYLLGVVENTGEVRIAAPWATAVLRDGSGAEVGVDKAKAATDCLEPGEDAPVKVLVTDPPEFQDVTWEVPASTPTWCPTRVEGLRVEGTPATLDVIGGWVQKGKVHHEGTVDARFVRIDVLAWDAGDQLVGTGFAYADLANDVLAAGESARFTARLHGMAATPERFELRVSARPVASD